MARPRRTASPPAAALDHIGALTPDPRNARKHGPRNVGTIVEALHEVGAARSIVIDEAGVILAGNATVEAAAEAGLTKLQVVDADGQTLVAVRRSGLTAAQKARLALFDNRAAELAEGWDAHVLEALRAEGVSLDGLWHEDELAALLRDTAPPAGLTDPDAVPDERPTDIQPGDLFALGDHRLLCGDSTNAEDVARVMAGNKAQLGLTSPPYAVGKEYETGVSFPRHLLNLEAWADRGLEAIEPGGFFFVNLGEIAAQSHAGPITGSTRQCLYLISGDYWRIFRARGYDLYAQRIWYKPFHRLQQPFWTYHTSIPHYQEWEHIWTWRLPGGGGDAVYDWETSVHAVWDTREEATDDKPLTRHVAAFPVGIPERAIKAHSLIGALVWEPCSGSGTTIIACEQLRRRCYAIEIEPRYVQVAIDRWEQFTGRTAVKVASAAAVTEAS